jgi:hypothetical protein
MMLRNATLALAAAFVAAPPVIAQTCPTRPPGAVSITWSGVETGCRSRCVPSEPLQFYVLTSYQPQTCDRMKWNFGDGTPEVEGPFAPVVHAFSRQSSALSFSVRLEIANAFGAVIDQANVFFVASCPLSVPPNADFTYVGLTSGCQWLGDRQSAPCFRGEFLRFQAQPRDGELESCDEILWDFGDGTADRGRVSLHSFLLPGDYSVREEIKNPLASRVVTRSITVAPRCEPPVIVRAPAIGPSFDYYVLRNSTVTIKFDVYSAQTVRYFWYRNSAYLTETSVPELTVGAVTDIAEYLVEMSSSCGGTRGVVDLIPVDQLPKRRAVRH